MPGPGSRDRRNEPYADRFLKPFREYEDDLGEDLIGGRARLNLSRPSRIPAHPRLVIPGDPASREAFDRAIQEDPASPLGVEVGSGMGRFLRGVAQARPDLVLLGCETRLGFCLKGLQKADRLGIKRLFMVWGDARATLPLLVPAGRASQAWLLYPDPWWKRRHAHRRHGARMAAALAHVLGPDGTLTLKSDVPLYLQAMARSFLETGLFRRDPGPGPDGFLPPTDRELRLRHDQISSFTFRLLRT
ncbi:MAG TPA: hypothetical protein PLQ97_13055 [Myxococcota bacterium]|nr:hypothetical protein [Myxococcota bacterium]HQK52118.1 hypothetical protein [Myxococcota bacterium]